MGLMDRLKETAQEVAGEARKATVQAQGKLSEVQLRRRMDEAARQLGYLVYRERTQGTPAGSEADTHVSEMQGLEQKLQQLQAEAAAAQAAAPQAGQPSTPAPGPGPVPTDPTAPPPSTPPTSSSEPTGGDFKL